MAEKEQEQTTQYYIAVDPNFQTNTIIKTEPQEVEEVEASLPCRLCVKTFANPQALRNHARVLHMVDEGEVDGWMEEMDVDTEIQVPNPVTIKTEDTYEPTIFQHSTTVKKFDMTGLVSDNIQYVIVRADQDLKQFESKTSKKVLKSKATPEKEDKTKEVSSLSGPFECLQESTTNASSICHQIFFSCCEYSVHFRDEHTRRRKQNKCQVCEKLLVSVDGVETVFPYVCQVCGAGFNAHSQLNEHTSKAHIKLKPYQCTICFKRFTQQGGLNQHLRMHRGDRPFTCTFCNKAFTQKSGLDQHLRIHTKVRPYRCVVCQKTFLQSVHLKQHMRTHTNVTPFQCAICEKRFKQSSHLNYHLKNHTEANMTDDQKKKYQELVGMLQEQQSIDENIDGTEATDEQVVVDERGYMLSDNGDDTWTVIIDEGQVEETEVIGV